jgi:hypothetical protein
MSRWFFKQIAWQQKLDKKLAYKALDIPMDDDMQISTTNGIGWKELAVVAGALLGGGWLYCNSQAPAPIAPPAVVAPQVETINQDYELRFFDADGNLIELPNISER